MFGTGIGRRNRFLNVDTDESFVPLLKKLQETANKYYFTTISITVTNVTSDKIPSLERQLQVLAECGAFQLTVFKEVNLCNMQIDTALATCLTRFYFSELLLANVILTSETARILQRSRGKICLGEQKFSNIESIKLLVNGIDECILNNVAIPLLLFKPPINLKHLTVRDLSLGKNNKAYYLYRILKVVHNGNIDRFEYITESMIGMPCKRLVNLNQDNLGGWYEEHEFPSLLQLGVQNDFHKPLFVTNEPHLPSSIAVRILADLSHEDIIRIGRWFSHNKNLIIKDDYWDVIPHVRYANMNPEDILMH